MIRILVILLGFLLIRCGASDDSDTNSSSNSFAGKYVLQTVMMSSASGLYNAVGTVSSGECSLVLSDKEPGIYDFVHVADCYIIFNGQSVPVRSRSTGTIKINDDGQVSEVLNNSAERDSDIISAKNVFSRSGLTKTVVIDIDGEFVTYIYDYTRR